MRVSLHNWTMESKVRNFIKFLVIGMIRVRNLGVATVWSIEEILT